MEQVLWFSDCPVCAETLQAKDPMSLEAKINTHAKREHPQLPEIIDGFKLNKIKD